MAEGLQHISQVLKSHHHPVMTCLWWLLLMQVHPAAQSSQEGSAALFADKGTRGRRGTTGYLFWAAGRAEKGWQWQEAGPVPGHPVGWGHGPGVRSCSQAAGREAMCRYWLRHPLVLSCQGLSTLTSKLAGFWPRAVVTLGNGTRAHVAGLSRGSGCSRAHQGATAAPT